MKNLNDHFNWLYIGIHLGRIAHRCEDSKFLDLGCGTRPYRELYEKAFGFSIAADLERRAKEIDVIASVNRLPFSDSAFDVTLLSEVIEHIEDDSLALLEIARVLKPGGHLLLTVPFMHPLHELPNDFRRYTEVGLSNVLRKSGFELICLARRGNLFSVITAMCGDMLVLGVESLVRVPFIGALFRPVRVAAAVITSSFYWLLSRIQYRLPHLHTDGRVGSLSGTGAVARWTLGYCVLARKTESEDSPN